MSNSAIKHDTGKPMMELISPEMMFQLSSLLTWACSAKEEGYEPRNWEKGMSYGRVFGACMRHLWAWWGGHLPTSQSYLFGDVDSESGFSHLTHALACIMFLVTYEQREVGTDDRPVKE